MTATIAIIGGGPAGLFAAEYLSAAGFGVHVYDRMPTLGRKFLMAGRGGLNLTHSEALETFMTRYGEASGWLAPLIEAYPPAALQAWADGLGAACFTGSSGRVFPKAMKASPLLRAWRDRLDKQGVAFHLRQRWSGWAGEALTFEDDAGQTSEVAADAVLLALGGASWPRLGSDGSWADLLRAKDVAINRFEAANCGVELDWSPLVRERFAGVPLKTIALSAGGVDVRGEAMITDYGLEGGAIYALSAPVRETLRSGPVELRLDLRPNQTAEAIAAKLGRARPGQSLSTQLKKTLGLSAAAAALVYEAGPPPRDALALARHLKSIPLTITAQRGLERAISSSGGIARSALTDALMLDALPGVFAAGEMLDWDAPTGGYLLQASFSTGLAAARGVERWLAQKA